MAEGIRTVATEVAAAFVSNRIDRLFLLTGGDQALWIALRDAGVRMIVARSEPGAVYMADGYARASRKVSATYGQAGPGAANVAAALADAYWAQSPVFALTGSTSTDAQSANEYQDLDQRVMFGPVTKWNGLLGEPERTSTFVTRAIQLAANRPAGPTHLDIPKNFFARPVTKQNRPASEVRTDITGASLLDVSPVLAALVRAKRPMILAGEGVRIASAWDELAKLSVEAQLPIVTTMGGKPAVLGSHPNLCGVVGRYSSVNANKLLAQSDFVLAFGSRLGGLSTNGYSLPKSDAYLVQVDIDPSALVNRHAPDLPIVADLRAFLPALRQGAESAQVRGPQAWLGECRESAARWQKALAERTASASSAPVLSPLTVLDDLKRFANEITVVSDTGYMAAWTGVAFSLGRYDSFFRAVGSLGWALPASIGVQMARREKVVCITGDGGAGYHLTDIETAVRYKSPLVIVILDNGGLMFEYHEQKYRWKGNVVAEANDFGPMDYAAAARAMGATAWRAETRESFAAALSNAMKAEGPTVIHALVDREAFPPVTNFDAVMAREL